MSYLDEDIVFYVEAYHNHLLADWCLENVRKCHPKSHIVLISDGDADRVYEAIGHKRSAEVIYGKRLWEPGGAGLLWERRALHFLSTPKKYMIKIDTDTGFYRRMSFLPKEDCIFGTIHTHPLQERFVQGGFIGVTSKAAKQIVISGLLASDFAASFHWEDGRGGRISSDDLAISAICAKLGIPIVAHNEVASYWRIRKPNLNLEYAVVHPCKDGKL